MRLIARKTVAKYCNEYLEYIEKLNDPSKDQGFLIEQLLQHLSTFSLIERKPNIQKGLILFLIKFLKVK